MASATRWTIRQEPYDPDARDADNDGIVQEQTPWERPAGTSLVDELGRAITRGANAGQRPRGLRVVGPRGNTISYTPTYERPGFAFGGGGTPLGEAGAPSLRERGLPSVRDITAPQPVTQTEPSLAPALPSAEVLPGTDAPEPPALRVDGRPKASAQEMADASRIAKSIQETVEAEFGPLETKQQVRDALNRAFPTASGNAEALLNSAEYWDENTERVKAVRNFAIGLLYMSQQDPQTAARISRLADLDTKDPNAGGVHMTRFDTYTGMIQSWAIVMNPSLNVNSLEPDKREMGEPWAYKMALSMKETGEFSDDEINQILQQSVAIHEFAHGMHLNAGLSHWGNDRGGVIPAEAMIQAFANVEKISVSDANDQINAYIQKNFTLPRSQETISEAITSLVRPKTGVEQAFVYELYDTIKWDGVDGDETTRSKILEDLSKASEYATTGGKEGQGSQYDEGIAETIAVMVATGTMPSGGEETLAHVQSIFPGSGIKTLGTQEKIEKKSITSSKNRNKKSSGVYEISTCSGFLERGPNGKFSPVGDSEPDKKSLEIDPLQSKIDLPSIRPGGRSGATRRLRTGARRGALALEPYDPDARDADGDGIVQEGTAWERPATARILDALGNEIRRGQQASVRPTGIRVVDRDGNDIDYKPTYEGGRAGTIGGSTIPEVRPSVKPPEALTPEKPAKKAAAKKPAKPKKETPLADHGARSLKERGLPSTREQYRAATTPPEPEVPEVPEAPEPKTPKAKKPKETPVVDDIALSPGVTLASADRPELEKPEKPRSPFKPSPPPLEGRAQELADEADGDFKKFMELLDEEGYVVFDYETTGLQDGNIPVQIGAVRIKDGKIVERFNVFTNPQRPLSDWSKENLKDKDGNPLTDEWLEGQTDLAEAHRQLAEFLGDSIIVAHNLPYDGEIIDRMMKDADIDYKPSGSIDTLMLLRSAVPKGDGESGPERHTLGSLADFFDVDLGDAAHTADADSEAAALVLQKAMGWAGDNDSSPDIFDAAKQKELFDEATKKYNADRKEYEVALKKYQSDLADYERAVTRADEPVVETPSSPATEEVKLSYVPGDVGDVDTIQRQFAAQYSWVKDDMEGFVEYELSPEELKRALEELDLPDKEALVTYLTDSAIARVGDYVDDVRRGPLYLSVTPQNFKKILEEKRFKSQFETGTSGGLFNPEIRRSIEDKYMGIPKDTPDELRPIYGFQLGEGEGDEVTRSGAAKAYGTIVVKLKDDVRGRTTMTAGDSLDHQLYGIPVDGDVTRERHLSAARRDYSQIWDQAKQGAMAEIVEDVLGGFYDWAEPYEDIITAGASSHYNEIQVHGGLTLDDVEEVIYTSDWTQQELLNPTWSDVDYQVAADARKAIIALLDEANIKHGEDW